MPATNGTHAHRDHAWRRVLVPLVVTLVALALPGVALSYLGLPGAASSVGLSGLAAVIATYVLGWRIGLGVVAAFAVGTPACLLASEHWLGAGVLMAAVGFAFGMTATRGWERGLTLVPIAFGFAVADPPRVALDIANLAAVTGVSITVALLAVVIVHAITRGHHLGVHGQVPRLRGIGYACMLAIAGAITTAIAVHGSWLHAGGWLIMTPFIVLQPDLKEALRKSLKRGLGTIAGFAIAFLLANLVSNDWSAYAIGIGACLLALYALDRHWDYAAYATALTVAVVFIEGAGTSISQTSELRLAATVLGVGICLATMAVANPIYVRADRRAREAAKA